MCVFCIIEASRSLIIERVSKNVKGREDESKSKIFTLISIYAYSVVNAGKSCVPLMLFDERVGTTQALWMLDFVCGVFLHTHAHFRESTKTKTVLSLGKIFDCTQNLRKYIHTNNNHLQANVC